MREGSCTLQTTCPKKRPQPRLEAFSTYGPFGSHSRSLFPKMRHTGSQGIPAVSLTPLSLFGGVESRRVSMGYGATRGCLTTLTNPQSAKRGREAEGGRVISDFASFRPWGGVRRRDRTFETVHQESVLITAADAADPSRPPTQLTAPCHRPSLAHVAAYSRRPMPLTPKSQTNVLGIKLGHKLLTEALRPRLSACVF